MSYSSPNLPVVGMKTYGKLTQNSGTVITRLVEPRQNAFTKIADIWYTAGATAHTLTVMRPLNKTTLAADAAASQAVVTLAADPGSYAALAGNITPRTANNLIASGDFVVYQAADGTFVLDTCTTGTSGTSVTLSNNLPTGGAKQGSPFWWFGVTTDTNPGDAQAHPQLNTTASTTTYYGNTAGSGVGFLFGSVPGASWLGMTGQYEPLIVHSNNATNAGTIERVTAVYTLRG